MVDFAPGMRTIIRDEEWMIKKIETNSLGNKTLYCVGVSPLVKDREAIFLADLEQIQVVDPAEVKLVADHSPFYKRALLYLESQWRQQIPTDSNLHIGHRAAMDLMPYQLDPAKLSLQRPRQRILIADTVGLGKTLEAGILMSELIARGKGKRILVVTVKSMMTQFQKEMWNRFTIPLVRLDSNRIQKIRASLPSNYNPFFYYDKTIISIDTLKRDVEYRTHLENAYWDIIVIDEAQNVAERGDHQAQRSRLAKLLADQIVSEVGTSYSPMETGCREPGAYVHSYNENDIQDAIASAQNKGYEPYNITTDTDYLFMIREVGGIATGAYVDGRNTIYGSNLFLNSNQGVECALVELGFISVEEDRNNMVHNSDGYAKGIANAIVQQILSDKQEDSVTTAP